MSFVSFCRSGLLTLVLIASTILSFPALAADKPDTAVNAVEQQVEALRLAMIAGDAKQLDKLAAAKLSYGHSGGLVENKAEFIHKLESGSSDFVTIELKNQHISLSGDVALVRHDLHADIKDGGVPNTIHLGILLVWQLQDGEWKLLARQAFKYPPKNP
ncbi:nuclear transport factor 2 family protein [Cellvibrio japonicus]|uniref:DUF4440 domain-containing protein n=1 Tax=Cellvibrio japonicus (strain Ueda107) TaxID=498211 RepID=B3PJK0_CELJU|nr:nuclear transport factor 2 family protein [Cellvibrio japonicus]ACE82974.1 hypothetical protein CJA_0606 [Cellvibrio japonicus Ueda107]QEI11286.1 nuclear transport factor 2 family protein [Cellvibrio japonicus]QEI14860.1 nuclear transport factor 2 family protein [Cellvibrio japonicus]QEI18440.1 nuclear transport factor 2 family protein [Cellvibrio japonicus]